MKQVRIVLLVSAVVALGILFALHRETVTPSVTRHSAPAPSPHATAGEHDRRVPSPSPSITFVGPRENIPADAPTAYGFWSFAVPVSGVLSRSGQPLPSEFAWMKQQGWKSVVNLRVDGERGEVGDDTKLKGFTDLGFSYLHLPLVDGHPPTDERAEAFLAFVINQTHQPVHVHCRGGIGRSGVMIALYRYAVQGWPLDKAIEESRAFRGGISALQKTWLKAWASVHPPGSHRP